MIKTSILGYPRIGLNRELKKATEAYWRGEISLEALDAIGKEIRKQNWQLQKNAEIDFIPSNDFSFYDGMLDMTLLLGAVPKRFNSDSDKVDNKLYFTMARGTKDAPAMEMTKWFDTNYHYIVPEFYKDQAFKLSTDKPFAEFKEALILGIKTRPVIIGPITYLMLGKIKGPKFDIFELIDPLLSVYISVCRQFKDLGADWVQIDEPVLAMDLDDKTKNVFKQTYEILNSKIQGLNIMLTNYFGPLKENLKFVRSLPVSGLHVDLVRAPEEASDIANSMLKNTVLSLGIIDGRNVWKTDLLKAIELVEQVVQCKGKDKVIVSTSCSLLHTPLDLENENDSTLDKEIKSWMAFSKQKLNELEIIKRALNDERGSISSELDENQKIIQSRKESKRNHIESVRKRLQNVTLQDYSRISSFDSRKQIQKRKLQLPLYPTTTIGSFPQTQDIRLARAKHKSGETNIESYKKFIREKIKEMITTQEEIGLDVLVHGEPERNDMVEYFGEMLEGFAFTKCGWVQSYGSRYVKPPIIFGDVYRPKPMTTEWIEYAQSLTKKPVKGMLTGPVTILQWSFVRDDEPRSETAKQIALALRDEVCDLESRGIHIIQIDEPAIREGLPLRRSDWADYLKWAVECFKLASCGVKDDTQIHTHMCYSEFNDIINAIASMDADVISIESSRSHMELLDAFIKFNYPNEIGPGVYDVHSPVVPSSGEIKELLKKASRVLPCEHIWVNPDCGLKTRGWDETIKALKAMVDAARSMREMQVVV